MEIWLNFVDQDNLLPLSHIPVQSVFSQLYC